MTFYLIFARHISFNFNPHFRKGSDLLLLDNQTLSHDFNPHFRKGSDGLFYQTFKISNNFNPHFRKGSDPITASRNINTINFNPHFRKGSDVFTLYTFGSFTISIHTSAREVTNVAQTLRKYNGFQSTLPQGK